MLLYINVQNKFHIAIIFTIQFSKILNKNCIDLINFNTNCFKWKIVCYNRVIVDKQVLNKKY